jgi:hypothetical protein
MQNRDLDIDKDSIDKILLRLSPLMLILGI